MTAPVLVPCLVTLRAEFNAVAPHRDTGSDGWLGDRAHALRSSDHNPDETGATPYEDADHVDEVHGLDVDDTGPWPVPGWFDAQVEHIRAEHQAGRDTRLQNIIRNGRIASRSWGWTWRPYGGSNGHYEHAHFSARYTSAQEADTSPWGVQEDDMPSVEDIVKGLLAEDLGRSGPTVAVALQSGYQNSNKALTELAALRKELAAVKAAVKAALPPA